MERNIGEKVSARIQDFKLPGYDQIPDVGGFSNTPLFHYCHGQRAVFLERIGAEPEVELLCAQVWVRGRFVGAFDCGIQRSADEEISIRRVGVRFFQNLFYCILKTMCHERMLSCS